MFRHYIQKGKHKLYIGPIRGSYATLYPARHQASENVTNDLTYLQYCVNIEKKVAEGYELKSTNPGVLGVARQSV